MPLRLYNSYSKQEEDFTPANPPRVTLYTCGPTVYGRPHIGNYSSFLMADLLRRWLEAGHNYQVTHVKNITDVGHLVADADEGEDKVEKQAREEHGEVTHQSVLAIARKYEQMYLDDEQVLNMKKPEHRPRATDFIDEMKQMIDVLLEKGNAYVTEDGIYFSVTSFPDYGRLSGNTLENLDAGNRVQVNDQKQHPADFALWKFCVGINEHHALRWPSPGTDNTDGFPGWHIECSAMSSSILGDTIDIHTGGEDNIFPHHECEIAQSECVSGQHPFVRHWLHKRRIDMGNEKMSKSLGNVKTIPDILDAKFSPLDLRYYFLSVHYRTQLKFTDKGLEDARIARKSIIEWMNRGGVGAYAQRVSPGQSLSKMKVDDVQAFVQEFGDAMDSDLNTPAALAAVFKCIKKANSTTGPTSDVRQALIQFIELIRYTFGCFDPEEEEAVPADVQALVDQRAAARENKDFAESDRLRDEIAALGWEVRDGAEGQVVKLL